MKRLLVSLAGVLVLAAGALFAVAVFSDDSKVATAYSVEGTEDLGTVWVKSCVAGDHLSEVTLLRDGAVVWSYKLAGKAGVSLAEPVDIRVLAGSNAYEVSGASAPAWQAGDQIVLKSTTGGYLSWALGAQPKLMSLDELRALRCVPG